MADAPNTRSHRFASIDILRGVVMIVMALDHVRDYIDRGAMGGSPTDLATTTPMLFMTRWITHICAPTFALTAGLGAWFYLQRSGRTRADLAKFLVTRGLWLMLLEVTVMRFGYFFSIAPEHPVFLLVFWSLGLSMIVLGALIWIPLPWLSVLSVATILLHPLLNGVTAARFGAFAPVWNVIHQVGAFQLGGYTFITPYPLVPWVAVMSLGFAMGPLFMVDAERRRRVLVRAGAAAIVAFVVLRSMNGFGDSAPWSVQSSPVMTALSFLNTTKYIASPSFLLMTLGPALLLLAWLEGSRIAASRAARIAETYGRVPLFYFVVHFFLAHALAVVLAFVTYGAAAKEFAFLAFPSMGGPAASFPTGFGYDLWVTYAVWLTVLAITYPLCRWFAGVKARRRDWWLSYL